MKTKSFVEQFKGHTIFAVWEVDNSGHKVGKAPLFSLGVKKARALALHIDEFQQFVNGNSAAPNGQITVAQGDTDEIFS